MPTTVQVRVKQIQRAAWLPNPKPVNPAEGEKPPMYLAAARRAADRDYAPRYDLG